MGVSTAAEVRDAMNKERYACARARDGERPVSYQAGGLVQYPVTEELCSSTGLR